jgi:hypothetical protein
MALGRNTWFLGTLSIWRDNSELVASGRSAHRAAGARPAGPVVAAGSDRTAKTIRSSAFTCSCRGVYKDDVRFITLPYLDMCGSEQDNIVIMNLDSSVGWILSGRVHSRLCSARQQSARVLSLASVAARSSRPPRWLTTGYTISLSMHNN